jgi:hypothetical protein
MTDIQNIAVTSTQIVTQPKPHTTYTIQGKYLPTFRGFHQLIPSLDTYPHMDSQQAIQ